MLWTIGPADEGRRLDVFLSEAMDMTRSQAAQYIKAGEASVNGRAETKAGFALRAGQALEFTKPMPRESHMEAQPLDLRIVYEDRDLAVIEKPSGMVVHPAAGNHDGTLVNALLYHLDGLSGIGGEIRPGIVHRIDKDTSGLLLVAKNDRSHAALADQIKAHSLERAYLAVVLGNLKDDEGFVDAPIGRSPKDRKKMAVVQGGREAGTHWRVLQRLRGACLVECRLTTGRTHQIRVHMASIGHPVAGDPLYGPKKAPVEVVGGQLLCAYRLGFLHPETGEMMRFTTAPEPRFVAWVRRLGGDDLDVDA